MDYLKGFARDHINFEKSEPIFPVPQNKQSILFMNHTDSLTGFFAIIDRLPDFKDKFKLLDYHGLDQELRIGDYIWDTLQVQTLLQDVIFALANMDKLVTLCSVSETEDISNLQKSFYSAYEFGDTTWFNLPPVPGEVDLYYFGKEGLRQWLSGIKFLCEDCIAKDFVLFVSED